MKKRVMFALIMLAVVVGAFCLRLIGAEGKCCFDALICCLSLCCAAETCKLVSAKGAPACVVSTTIFPALSFAAHILFFMFNLSFVWYVVIQVCVLALAFLLTFVFYACLNTKYISCEREKLEQGKAKFAINVALKSLFCFVYPTMFFVCLMLLNRIDALKIAGLTSFKGTLGWVVLVCAVVVPIITDTFAMLCGMLFKGPKLCKKISPNKTVSGAVCAVVLSGAIMGGLFFAFNAFSAISAGFLAFNIKFWHFIIVGVVGSVVCQAGDLFESMLKRRAGVKDSGTIIPGHGGFLDRLDSHIFNAPFVLVFFVLTMII